MARLGKVAFELIKCYNVPSLRGEGMKQAFFELKRDWIIIPAPGTIFLGYCGTSCALRSSSTRSSTKSTPCHGVVLRSRIPRYFLGKTQGVQRTTSQKSAALYFCSPERVLGRVALCYSGSAPLTRFISPLRVALFYIFFILPYFLQFFNWKSADFATNFPQGVSPQNCHLINDF